MTRTATAKDVTYYGHVRHEILPYLPRSAEAVFEIGCAEGATLRFLKESKRAKWVGGIEKFEAAASAARLHVDWLRTGDIERADLELPDRRVDVLLCLDVLEHLIDPWGVLRKLCEALVLPGGVVVVTLPNVRNWRLIGNLILKGEWEYQPSGILDRTHLRFFTERSGRRLLEMAGLASVRSHVVPLRRYAGVGTVLAGLGLGAFIASQILFTGAMRGSPSGAFPE
jgi:SAM-dependent methyltransferase